MSDEWDEEATSTTDVDEVRGKLAGVGTTATKPYLTVLTGSLAGHLFQIKNGTAVIGRASTSELRIDDDGMSRAHARIRTEAEHAWVEDLGSRNGTFVNGQRLTAPIQLREGDKIQVGRSTVLRFDFHDELDESFHQRLLSSALRDGLTKLFNKRYFLDRLDSELKFALRHGTALSLLMLDLDHFKKVNDTLGHLAGDTVLATVAEALGRAVRDEDVVARFGGEEVAIVLRSINLEGATLVAERLRRIVEGTVIPYDEKGLHVTVSIGVAGFPALSVTQPDELVQAADEALYRAKAAGRNRISR